MQLFMRREWINIPAESLDANDKYIIKERNKIYLKVNMTHKGILCTATAGVNVLSWMWIHAFQIDASGHS